MGVTVGTFGCPLPMPAPVIPPLPPTAVLGTPDGAPIHLRSGLSIQRRSIGGQHVTPQEIAQIIAGLSLLPLADQQLVASRGVTVDLVPTAALEGALLGATTIVRPDDAALWQPTHIRVAVDNMRGGVDQIEEVIQHEMGHAVAVLRNQDRSEAAAIGYAQQH